VRRIVLGEIAIKQGKQSFFQQVIPFCLKRRQNTLRLREMCVVECVFFTQGLLSLDDYQRTTEPFV